MLKGICKNKRKEKKSEETTNTVPPSPGAYLEDRSKRCRRTKQYLDNLVHIVTSLNSECGYGIALVATAAQPSSGPRGKSLNIVLADKDGHQPIVSENTDGLREEARKLRNENESLKELVDKLQNVARGMQNEFNMYKSQI